MFVIIATLLLVEQGKGCAIQSLSADQREQRQSKNPHNKETKRKKSCVSSSFMSLVNLTILTPIKCKPMVSFPEVMSRVSRLGCIYNRAIRN